MRGGAHLRDLAPGLHSSEGTSHRWRAVGDNNDCYLITEHKLYRRFAVRTAESTMTMPEPAIYSNRILFYLNKIPPEDLVQRETGY